MAGYNLTRTVEEVLEHFKKDEKNLPSFTVHLHPEYWTLNNGSKFLYNNPVASLLDDIRAHRIPVDFLELFDSAKVPFYDGCMVVELLDYRPQKSKEPALETPERTCVVLHPNSETLWADICLLNQKAGSQWTDQDALGIEARLLMATAPPLCLDPDPHLTRIANNILKVSTPTVPVSLKRKASVLDPEEYETDKARRAKLMQYMNPRQHRSHAPNYRILDAIQGNKMAAAGRPPSAGPRPSLQIASTVHPSALQNVPPQSAVTVPSTNGADLVLKKPNKKKKTDPSPPSYATNENGSNPSSTPTPVNGLPVNQYIPPLQQNGHHSPPPVSQAPMQPSASGQQYPQPSQPNQPLRQPQHPQGPISNFQATAPTHFFNQAPPQRNVQPKPNTPTPQGMPHQANAQHVPTQNQMHPMYPHIPMQQGTTPQRLAATQSQNGRATPQGQPSRSPMNPNAATAQRGNPMAVNQASNSRSPMPNAQPLPQMTHHNQHPNFPQYNLAHLRASQHLQPHMVNSGPHPGGPSPIPQAQQMQPSQDQQGHTAPMIQQYPTMYSYANYGIQSRPPPGYAWSSVGVGRGVPQHQMPGMASNAAHPPHMLNVGKVVPGGMQGR